MAKLSDGTDSQGFLGSQWPEVKKILHLLQMSQGCGTPYEHVFLHHSPSTCLSYRRKAKVLVHTDKQREARKVKQVEQMFNVSSSWDVGNGCSF